MLPKHQDINSLKHSFFNGGRLNSTNPLGLRYILRDNGFDRIRQEIEPQNTTFAEDSSVPTDFRAFVCFICMASSWTWGTWIRTDGQSNNFILVDELSAFFVSLTGPYHFFDHRIHLFQSWIDLLTSDFYVLCNLEEIRPQVNVMCVKFKVLTVLSSHKQGQSLFVWLEERLSYKSSAI